MVQSSHLTSILDSSFLEVIDFHYRFSFQHAKINHPYYNSIFFKKIKFILSFYKRFLTSYNLEFQLKSRGRNLNYASNESLQYFTNSRMNIPSTKPDWDIYGPQKASRMKLQI